MIHDWCRTDVSNLVDHGQLGHRWNQLSSSSHPNSRVYIPINDQLPSIQEQKIEGGNHLTLVTGDITMSTDEKGKVDIQVHFRHFDSIKDSGNLKAAQIVAEKLLRVCCVY